MRSPDEIIEIVRRRYTYGWRDWLDAAPNELIVTLQPPPAGQIAHDFTRVDEWARQWHQWSDGRSMTGLRSKTIRTPLGDQTVPTHIIFRDAEAIAETAGDLERWRIAASRYPQLRALGLDHAAVRPHLARVTDLVEKDFNLLLLVAGWFRNNLRSGLTMRQVPVEGLHTKWLAKHRGIVIPLVSGRESWSDELDDLDNVDLDALGLKQLPAHIDIILADPRDRAKFGGLRHLRAPVEEIAALPLAPTEVLVVENKESALPIPDRAGLVIVHSLGNRTEALAQLKWIARARCRYWGDLDRAGFTLLSRARTWVPGLESVLMSSGDVEEFSRFGVADDTRADAPESTLTDGEQTALDSLRRDRPALRIEQERIPWRNVLESLFG